MGLLEWATSPWGQTVPIHIAWFLIWVSVIAGLLFLIVHAIYVECISPSRKSLSSEASPEAVAALPKHVPRHSLVARLFHWVMAASMFTLLFTAFLPKVGIQFNWVTYHWIAGAVLTVSILFHVIHASFWLDFWSIWPDKIDRGRRLEKSSPFYRECLRHRRERFAKYPLENKLYHGAIIAARSVRDLYRRFHDVSRAHHFLSPQSLSFQRYDVGPDVCPARPGGRGTDCARHDACLLGTSAGEARHHEIDDLRLDGPRLLSARARSRALADRHSFVPPHRTPPVEGED
jgi:hypothetical protein